jgi:hypothetical protein
MHASISEATTRYSVLQTHATSGDEWDNITLLSGIEKQSCCVVDRLLLKRSNKTSIPLVFTVLGINRVERVGLVMMMNGSSFSNSGIPDAEALLPYLCYGLQL